MSNSFTDNPESDAAFGIRGQRFNSKMLELRLNNGEMVAIGYHWLQSIQFTPDSMINITFTTHDVQIEGRHLEELYRGLLEEKVPYIQEGISVHDLTPESEPFIHSIKISVR